MKKLFNFKDSRFTGFAMLAMAMALSVLSSCSNDEENTIDENEIRITAVHPSQTSRVNATGFDGGDQIGVFVVAEGTMLQPYGNSVNNCCFTLEGNQWKPLRKYYWNEGKHNVYAYYPYCADVNDTEEFAFKLQTDQSTDKGYGSSDFLWAKAEGQQAGTAPVSLMFSHVFSRAIVELVKGSDYEGEFPDNVEVYLHNTVTTANVDLSVGSSAKDGYAATETIKMQKLSNGKFAAIVVPQRIDTRRPLVEVIMGKVSYLMEGTMAFKQGFQHTISITITANPQQAEIEIGGGIGNWN